MPSFHDIRFPVDISLHSSGGPERRTDIVATGSNREERNARWANSRRRFDAGSGVKSLAAIAAVVAFFEERRGRLYGFRWRDRMDFKSGLPAATPAPADQKLAVADGATAVFQLVKTYGSSFAPYARLISKPVDGSVRVAVNGVEKVAGVDFAADAATGLVTFATGKIPPANALVSAGYLFDVPVRFDTDYLEIDLSAFQAGDVPKIPLIEIIP